MKANQLLPICSLSLLFMMIGCDRNSNAVTDKTIADAAQIVANYNEEKFPMTKAEYLSGEISIRTSATGEIVIFVNWDNKQRDNSRFFILQREASGDGKNKVVADFNNAQVLFFENNIIVNPRDQKDVFLFALRGHSDEKHLSRFDFTKTITGYGLLMYNPVYHNVIGKVPSEPFQSIFTLLNQGQKYVDICDYANDVGSAQGCDGGGAGAGGCSLGTYCSVSNCIDGYYACCGDFWQNGSPPQSTTTQCKCCANQ